MTDSTASVRSRKQIPESIRLAVTPNPFNSSCVISAPPNATIEIFDINGKRIAELPPNTNIWTPEKEIGSGVYLVKATKDGQSATKRIVYLR